MANAHQPAREVVERALASASRAPSVANSQPWLWRINRVGLELFVDGNRRLARADPDARSLLLSCGAALGHLRVAMAAQGWASQVVRMPDERVPSLLASIEFQPVPPTPTELALAAAIEQRVSDRRPMSSWPVTQEHVRTLAEVASARGGFLIQLGPIEATIWARLSEQVMAERAEDPGIRAELDPSVVEDLSWRGGDSEVGLLLATTSDDRLAELRAGEALSAVLLEATRLGLATRLDSQPTETPRTRALLERGVLGGSRSPQILVVVGWPSSDSSREKSTRREAAATYKVVDSDSLAHQLESM